MRKLNKKELIIYNAFSALIEGKHWEFMDDILKDKQIQVWRLPTDELVAFVYVTKPCKKFLPSREIFLAQCKRLFPILEDTWKELE